MNLPSISQLRINQSTYVQFSKAFVDFDKAIQTDTVCYFSKCVALNLPNWSDGTFSIDLSSINIVSDNPNLLFPKTLQYYTENIIRQNIGENSQSIEEIAELAFWKTLYKFGMTKQQIRDSVVFSNEIAYSNFVTNENNNGWAEIVCQIPNKCKLLVPAWKTITSVKDVVQDSNSDVALYDNLSKQFLFSDKKDVLDFNNFQFNEVTNQEFQFNVLLLFYKDSYGVEKLHGINFIKDYEDYVTEWKFFAENPKQITNKSNTIGYQFKFNKKTVNNNATQTFIYELQENSHFNTFSETLSKLNSFLEIEMRKNTLTI